MAAIKWLVLWWTATSVSTGCPDFKADEYTNEMPTTSCAVYHCKQVYTPMLKEFDTKFGAQDFINKAPDFIKKRMRLIDIDKEAEDENTDQTPHREEKPKEKNGIPYREDF